MSLAVDAAACWNDDRRRQESRRSLLLRREPTPCTIESHGSLQRQPTTRPLLLNEQRVRPTRVSLTHGEIDCVSWFGTPLLKR